MPGKTEFEDHLFVKPEIIVYPKAKGGGGGIPPTYIPHEDNEFDGTRRSKGLNFLLNDVILKSEIKKLRDNMDILLWISK